MSLDRPDSPLPTDNIASTGFPGIDYILGQLRLYPDVIFKHGGIDPTILGESLTQSIVDMGFRREDNPKLTFSGELSRLAARIPEDIFIKYGISPDTQGIIPDSPDESGERTDEEPVLTGSTQHADPWATRNQKFRRNLDPDFLASGHRRARRRGYANNDIYRGLGRWSKRT
jgi:hypothetical protein